MYSRAEIRKAERRLNRERAENYRAVRKMNHRFFKSMETESIAGGDVLIAPEEKSHDEVSDDAATRI